MDNMQRIGKRIGINTLISWGASVVIIGLTFKILHWAGGEWMIAIGLIVEAGLFFLMGYASLSDPDHASLTGTAVDTRPAPATRNFEEVLATKVDEEVIEKLKGSFDRFSKTVESVNSITGSATATQGMMTEIEHATVEIQELRRNLAELNAAYRAQLEAFRKA